MSWPKNITKHHMTTTWSPKTIKIDQKTSKNIKKHHKTSQNTKVIIFDRIWSSCDLFLMFFDVFWCFLIAFDRFWSILIISKPSFLSKSIKIDQKLSKSIKIDQNWSFLIDFDRFCSILIVFWSILIEIARHHQKNDTPSISNYDSPRRMFHDSP